jgi:hypothetical protein
MPFACRAALSSLCTARFAYVNPQPGFFFGVNGKPAPRDVLRGVRTGGLRLRIRISLERAIIGIPFAKQIGR